MDGPLEMGCNSEVDTGPKFGGGARRVKVADFREARKVKSPKFQEARKVFYMAHCTLETF